MQSSRSALPTSWISRTNPDKQKEVYAQQKQKEPFAKTRKVLFLRGGVSPLCRCATSLPKGETSWFVRKSKKIRSGFSALPLGELAFAKQMTERAKSWPIRIRANLMRICQFVKPPQSLPAANPAPSRREPALSVAARHLSQRERQVGLCVRAKNSLRLLGSPFGRAGICEAND